MILKSVQSIRKSIRRLRKAHWLKLQPAWVSCPTPQFVSPKALQETIANIQNTPNQPPFQKKQSEQIIAQLTDPTSSSLQIILVPATGSIKQGIPDQFKTFPSLSAGAPNSVSLLIYPFYPLFRGTVHITSADPLAQPAINPAYLTHPADTYLLTTAFIFCDRLMQSSRAADSHQTTCAGRGRGSAGTLRGGGSGQGAQHNILPSVQDVCTGQIVDVRLRVKGLRGCECAMRVFFRGELADCLCSCGEGGG